MGSRADQAGVAYVRTYDVELEPTASGPSSIEAVVRHIRAFGPIVRLELDLVDGGKTIEAHIPRNRLDGPGIGRKASECTFFRPTYASSRSLPECLHAGMNSRTITKPVHPPGGAAAHP